MSPEERLAEFEREREVIQLLLEQALDSSGRVLDEKLDALADGGKITFPEYRKFERAAKAVEKAFNGLSLPAKRFYLGAALRDLKGFQDFTAEQAPQVPRLEPQVQTPEPQVTAPLLAATPEQVEAFGTPALAAKPTFLEPPKPVIPVAYDDLLKYLKENMPQKINVRGIELELRTERASLPAGDGAQSGVQVSYWLVYKTGRAEKITWEIIWCESGEPNVAALTEYFQKNAEGIILPDGPIRRVIQPAPRGGINISGDVVGAPAVGEHFSVRMTDAEAKEKGLRGAGATFEPSIAKSEPPGLANYLKEKR